MGMFQGHPGSKRPEDPVRSPEARSGEPGGPHFDQKMHVRTCTRPRANARGGLRARRLGSCQSGARSAAHQPRGEKRRFDANEIPSKVRHPRVQIQLSNAAGCSISHTTRASANTLLSSGGPFSRVQLVQPRFNAIKHQSSTPTTRRSATATTDDDDGGSPPPPSTPLPSVPSRPLPTPKLVAICSPSCRSTAPRGGRRAAAGRSAPAPAPAPASSPRLRRSGNH